MKNIKFGLVNILKNMKNEKELKSSFIISIIGMAINNVAFTILWYYFGKTVGVLNGWVATDIFGLYAINSFAFGIVNAFFYGMVEIPNYIVTGNLDKFLLTPKNLLLKISVSKFQTSAIGDMLFGLICGGIYIVVAKISMVQILLMILFTIIVSIIFYSFSLICMTVSFYLLDGRNISTGLYGMFISNSLYHGGAFTGLLRIIFIFVMPSLLIGVLPVEIMKNFDINSFLLILVLTVFWVIVSVLFFYKSLKKYESNNLFGFGG